MDGGEDGPGFESHSFFILTNYLPMILQILLLLNFSIVLLNSDNKKETLLQAISAAMVANDEHSVFLIYLRRAITPEKDTREELVRRCNRIQLRKDSHDSRFDMFEEVHSGGC